MKILKGILAATLFASTMAKADPPATHGMLLFGDKVTYASHLPMFHNPHDYQLIVQLTLYDLPRSQTLLYYDEAKHQGKELFTLVPEELDLTKIIDGTITSFNASVFDGHFEKGGQNLGTVLVEIQEIVYSAKLDGNQIPDSHEEYLVFGSSEQFFAVHLISEKPSFDMVMQVSQPQQLCQTRTCSDYESPINMDSPIIVKHGKSEPVPASFLGSIFDVYTYINKTLYFEKDELSH